MGAKEACGVFAAHSKKGTDVVPKILKGLEALQHRGQESWGIAVVGKPVFKRMGLAFNWTNFARDLSSYKGASGIGHIRYSTKGRSNLGNAQPIQIGNEFSIAHNGTIFNMDDLKRTVLASRASADCSTDTKVVGHRLLQILKEENDWFYAFERLAKEVRGAYSFTILNKRGLRSQGPERLQAALHRVREEVGYPHRGLGELRPDRSGRGVREGR